MAKEDITMRHILASLTKELGKKEGKEIFEWYCKTYNVNIADYAPSTIVREVFGL